LQTFHMFDTSERGYINFREVCAHGMFPTTVNSGLL
jgi:hypothetical protein